MNGKNNLISGADDLVELILDADIDFGAGGINRSRVCDRAVWGINELLDGDPWLAFKRAGIEGWKRDAEEIEAHDKVIAIQKKRLEKFD